jgi:primosomal protein N' (replication factor Y) (superfamily II helicase)
MLVEVALPAPLFQTFTYSVEGSAPGEGTRVRVPFGREERIGWVVGRPKTAPERGLKSVNAVLDAEPSVPADLLRLCRWMADYYVAPLGLALRTALPAVMTDVSRDYVSLARPSVADGSHTPRERRLLEAIAPDDGPHSVVTLRKQLDMGSLWPEIRRLTSLGMLTHQTVAPREPAVRTQRIVSIQQWLPDLAERDRVLGRARRQREAYEVLEAAGGRLALADLLGEQGFGRSVIGALAERGVVEVTQEEVARDPFAGRPTAPPPPLEPTAKQAEVIRTLIAGLDDPKRRPFLLHGVTGSGKTLVYIELIRAVLARGRTAIVLVPEIALTPQTVFRFRAHFGDEVAVLHSALSDGERYDAWRALRAGEKRIAVGARSALFAPVPGLGAVIVDEEHDGSYKQSETPRYQARDLAVVRAEAAGAVCVLGSATPSLESWWNAERGKFTVLSLPERVGGGVLPPVRVVDLRAVRRTRVAERAKGTGAGGEADAGLVLSEELSSAVTQRLARREQVILLLNRRGYSSFVQCRDCGDVSACIHCSVSLTYHRLRHRLVCHHCRHEEDAPSRCPRCGSQDLAFRGLGTEQVERIVAETFSAARIARMDVDTTSGKWSHHEILGRVERGEVDILLGTQMIAKGLDFPNVTLVGVVNADVGIHLPDFRASERTFQLLSQVAGRAGRGTKGGEVILQTSLPQHYAIQAAVTHDYHAFAKRELDERKSPAYPPHARLANVVVSSPSAEAAAGGAEGAAGWTRRWLAKSGAQVELVGPAPAPIERLHGRWRWHFLLRAVSARSLGETGRALLEGYRTGKDVRLVFDRDPSALL